VKGSLREPPVIGALAAPGEVLVSQRPGICCSAPFDETFRHLMDEPDAHLHVTGFAEGDVAFVLTRDGLEARKLDW
jgi:hypothetical protein